jgi:HPt (histidine-containing phosphotransfer) domain-containing protein/HAMP domain-containing protein
MNIRQRIVLLVALAFTALAGIGGFSVYQASISAREVRTVTEGVVPSAAQSVALLGQLKDVQIAVQDMVSSHEPATVEQARAALAERKALLQHSLDEQLAGADTSAQRGLVQVAADALKEYFQAIDDTARLKAVGQQAMAEATLAGTVAVYLREQGESLQALQVEKTRRKDDAIAALNSQLDASKAMLMLISVMAVTGLGAMGVLLYRQVVLPIAAMQRKMTAIAATQDYTERMPIERMDEVGRSMAAFNVMIERIEQSSALVREKNAEIHAMLHSIPQGILMIDSSGCVHPEFSDHLRQVLETQDIAGREIDELLFQASDLGADVRSQANAAVGACLGEDAMNFEFNAHLLPAQCEIRLSSGAAKVLDLHWAPMVNELDGTVQRLLLCLRDVTELRRLEREAKAQAHELALVGQLLAVSQEKFHDFVDTCVQLIAQGRQLIARGSDAAMQRAECVALLFRNMHTIKGNARTHGLLQLAESAHHAEERYSALRSDSSAWDTAALNRELQQVSAALQEYVDINDRKLGRSGPGRRGNVERFLMVPVEQVQRLQQAMNQAGSDAAQLDEARALVASMGTERLEDALGPVLESMPELAAQLGKQAPVLAVNDNGIVVQTQVSGVLRNAFVHLYRNALDHGLEPADDRLAAGKPSAGSITLAASLTSEVLRLELRDDGQGLRLDRIRDRAQGAGLLQTDAGHSDEALANLIFASGFSTATAVTDVSGRGVGLDAVKGFIEAQGGTVRIELEPGMTVVGGRPFAVVVSLPAKYAVAPRGAVTIEEQAWSH